MQARCIMLGLLKHLLFEFDESNYVNPRHLYRIFISEANPEFVRLILSTPWGV